MERIVCPFGFSWRVHKRLINRHDKTLGVEEGVGTELSLHVTGFWDVTQQTVAQIYQRFGGTY